MQATQSQVLKRRLQKMKERCYNPNSKSYHRYGGRGIKVCDEWLNDHDAFVQWALENGYSDGLAIDRIDNNGDYCPENCRFVTLKKNNQNRCTSKLYTYKGKTQNLMEWCNELSLSYTTVLMRIRRGWDFEKAISPTVRKRDQETLIGKKFGRLTVLEYMGVDKNRKSIFLCCCDCGNKISLTQDKLVSGHTKSCGCFRKEVTVENSKKSPTHMKHMVKLSVSEENDTLPDNG